MSHIRTGAGAFSYKMTNPGLVAGGWKINGARLKALRYKLFPKRKHGNDILRPPELQPCSILGKLGSRSYRNVEHLKPCSLSQHDTEAIIYVFRHQCHSFALTIVHNYHLCSLSPQQVSARSIVAKIST